MAFTLYPGENGFLRMRRLAKALEEVYGPLSFKVVHVAGTSGKGSTATITARLLEGAGYKVGLFLTPYFVVPEDQIQVNGRMISSRENAKLNDIVKKLAASSVVPEFGLYSNFEKLVARALVYFIKQKVDVVVLETGMGGLYDATNAIESELAVITPISFDHERLLGPAIKDIARHKAGIIKTGNHAVVIGRQQKIVADLLREASHAKGIRSLSLGKAFIVGNIHVGESGTTFDYHTCDMPGIGSMHILQLHIPLIGVHQADNAALAITAALQFKTTSTHRKAILKNLFPCLLTIHNPGRFEILNHKNKKIIMDVAHNPEKITAVVRTFQALWPGEKTVLIFSCKWTKDARAMARTLRNISQTVIATQYIHYSSSLVDRVMGKPQLFEAFQEAGFGNVRWVADPSQALQEALTYDEKFILITGSFHLLRDIKLIPANDKLSGNL